MAVASASNSPATAPVTALRPSQPKPAAAHSPQAAAQAPTTVKPSNAGPTIPEWVKDAVFYQIFPDRFANGDTKNDPAGTLPWGSNPTNDSMLGGDLIGITQKMDYLTKLGVNALYMNPVFSSPSNHGYDTTDYEHVNPRLGGDDAFRQMIDTAHQKGVNVMLDGVFNHTSHQHPWFKDIRDNGPKSEFNERYSVSHWPIRYERDAQGVLRSPDYKSWWGYATLPVLTNDNPKVRDYFLTGQDAIVKRWIRDYHVDGWRMDVADELPGEYWKVARQSIKGTDPNAYLVAENWHDATSMVKGDQFDGAMNYQYFQQPAVEFFAKKNITSDDFVHRLENAYPGDAKFGMLNILDSHDTPRFISEAGGDWYRQRPAAIFQMTYVGAPVVYYGDEMGVSGGKDPDSRRTFPWQNVPGAIAAHPQTVARHGKAATTQATDSVTVPAAAPGGTVAALDGAAAVTTPASPKPATGVPVDPDAPTPTQPGKPTPAPVPDQAVSNQLFDLYSKLIATRKREDVLRRGDFSVLMTHNDNRTLAYRRALSGTARDAIVALNNDVQPHDVTVPVGNIAGDGTSFTDALSGARFVVSGGKLTVKQVDGNYGAILLRDAAAS